MDARIVALSQKLYGDASGAIFMLNEAALKAAEQIANEQPHLSVDSLAMYALDTIRDGVTISAPTL